MGGGGSTITPSCFARLACCPNKPAALLRKPTNTPSALPAVGSRSLTYLSKYWLRMRCHKAESVCVDQRSSTVRDKGTKLARASAKCISFRSYNETPTRVTFDCGLCFCHRSQMSGDDPPTAQVSIPWSMAPETLDQDRACPIKDDPAQNT